MAVDSNGDILRHDDDFRIVVENSPAASGFADHWAGCCVDNEVGAAGSTGKGEENIKISAGTPSSK